METIKELFGEESLNFETFESKVKEKGLNLYDLNKGGYLSKEKYDKLNAKFEQFKKDNDTSKYADYETLKAENETLKAEKTQNELMSKLASSKVGEKYRKFVLSEVKALVTEDKNFDTCLAEYLKENEQFLEVAQKDKVFTKANSSVELEKGGSTNASINKKMNDLLRKGR